MREIPCILFLGFVALLTHPPVVVAIDSIKNPEFDPVETPIITSAGDTTDVRRLLRRETGTTNNDTLDVNKKSLLVDIRTLSNPETDERNIADSIASVIFKVLGKVVGRAKADKWKANMMDSLANMMYKTGVTPADFYTYASTKTNLKTRDKYKRAGDAYAAFWETK
ncbi:Putative RxLR effector [Phytophthora palmivora]|uniref:RxLR effector n=1 Tax=Phytophthora palmivora TaxID=4796 RepID=A0A2P4YQP2_9STRA|nr:Putative RxLR effector [Phytophthora palmivora]